MKKNRLSLYTIFILFLLMLAGRTWKQDPHPISWDVAGYYLYLPNAFIYHDIEMKNFNRMDSLRIRYETSTTFYQVHPSPLQKQVIKYTMGNSLLYAPFFFTGHVVAKISGTPADGYSWPYQQSLMWGTLLYAALALWFVRKILLHFFDDKTTTITLIGIIAGTNAFLMLSMDNLQIHYHLFFAYTLFLWINIRYHLVPSFKKALLLGLSGGLIILIRPTDLICWIIPLLWGVKNPAGLLTKIRQHVKYIPFILATCFIMVLPQLIYWKMMSGSWLYNSYNNPGEGLDLTAPHTLPFLFSYRKGWLVYTPLVFFIVAGLIIQLKKNRETALPVTLFFLLNVWIVSSWTCWWYAGSFSSRAIIQSYAVLMIPLGYMVQFLWQRKGIFAWFFRGLFFLVIIFNLFQTWQYIEGILRPDGMTKAYYWKMFGTIKPTNQYDHLLLKNKFIGADTLAHTETLQTGYEFFTDFDTRQDTKPHQADATLPNGKTYPVLVMDTNYRFCTLLERPYKLLTDKYYAYVRVKGFIRNPAGGAQNPVELIRTMQHTNKNYAYASSVINPNMPADTSWQPFTYDYVFPDVRSKNDVLKIYFWHRGASPVYFWRVYVQILEATSFPELE